MIFRDEAIEMSVFGKKRKSLTKKVSHQIKDTFKMLKFSSGNVLQHLAAQTQMNRQLMLGGTLRSQQEAPFSTQPLLPQHSASRSALASGGIALPKSASDDGIDRLTHELSQETAEASTGSEKPADRDPRSLLHPAGRSRSVFGSNRQMLTAESARTGTVSIKEAEPLPAEASKGSKQAQEKVSSRSLPAESAEASKGSKQSQKKEMSAESAEASKGSEAESEEQAEEEAEDSESEESILQELRQSADWDKSFGISEARGLIYIKDGEVSRFRTLAEFKEKMGSRIDGKKFPKVGSMIDWRGGKLISTKSRK
jgi:hypothetical protein